MPKFFISPEDLQGNFLVLTGENAAHARVLRLKPGEQITVCDGLGTDYECTVSDVSPDRISMVVCSQKSSDAEPNVYCRVFMAFSKADKFEHVVQKATELGASEVIAFPSARCVSKPDEKTLAKKLERWQKIADSAAGQCGRGRVPSVRTASSFEQALEMAGQSELVLLPYENEQHLSIRSALGGGNVKSVSIITGPEGGFEASEIEAAKAKNCRICTLGPRILRCETAPLCALTAVLFACGALD